MFVSKLAGGEQVDGRAVVGSIPSPEPSMPRHGWTGSER
jgi:hypothetical protein